MRMAMIASSVFGDYVGGVTNHIRFMAREMTAKGHELRMFNAVWDHEFPKEQVDDGYVTVKYVNMGKPPYNFKKWTGKGKLGFIAGFMDRISYGAASKRLVDMVSEWNPDLVWQHDFSSSWLSTKRLSRGRPVVLTNHLGEYLMLQNRWYCKPLLRRILKHYSAIIGPSKELTPCMFKNSHTVHNGVDLDQFGVPSFDEKKALKKRLFGYNDRWVIFCPRRLAPTKGIIFLARAMLELDKLPEVRSNFVFVIAGTDYDKYPTYAENVHRILDQIQTPTVKLGNVPVSEMSAYYQASDLVVIPSLMEAVSLSALESMASGVPVLSTNVGGMPEIIEHGNTGYLVNAESSDELREAIMAIYKDKARDEVADRALEMVRSRYSWTAIADITENILLNCLKESKSSLQNKR